MSQQKIIVGLAVALGFLITAVSLVGILTPDFYQRESFNWQVQSLGQDIINLVLAAPALLLASQTITRSKRTGRLLMGGVLLYLNYTFLIYTFDVHFNSLFLFYCIIWGLSFYLFVYLISGLMNESFQLSETRPPQKVIGLYFIIISLLFYFLWLSDVIPASLSNETPSSLVEVGLPTNPVHVLDLSIVLPAIFITGVLLLKNKKLGHVLAPIILVFSFLMDITIGTLSYMMMQKGLNGSFTLTIVMGSLSLLSAGMLVAYLKKISVHQPTHRHDKTHP